MNVVSGPGVFVIAAFPKPSEENWCVINAGGGHTGRDAVTRGSDHSGTWALRIPSQMRSH
jgi:hypothetical protein